MKFDTREHQPIRAVYIACQDKILKALRQELILSFTC